MLVDAVKRCQAALITDRAISYRTNQASSGAMFTIDTESGHPDVAFIIAASGLVENVVRGTVDPDEFYDHKPNLKAGHRCVLSKQLGRKQIRMVCSGGHTGEPVANQRPRPAPRALLPERRRCAGTGRRRDQDRRPLHPSAPAPR